MRGCPEVRVVTVEPAVAVVGTVATGGAATSPRVPEPLEAAAGTPRRAGYPETAAGAVVAPMASCPGNPDPGAVGADGRESI